jgi:hypothetical protein
MAVRSPPSVFKEMRLMDATMIDEHLENIDRRLTRIEQILPSLATKAEFQTLATKDALKTLATKEDLKTLATKAELEALATKEDLKTLATKEELKTLATKEELREEGERSRRHMDVIAESLHADIQLIAEHVVSARPKPTESS